MTELIRWSAEAKKPVHPLSYVDTDASFVFHSSPNYRKALESLGAKPVTVSLRLQVNSWDDLAINLNRMQKITCRNETVNSTQQIMLILRGIQIKNFRSIKQEEFDLTVMSVLVGKNDVGKSNVLEAIRVLLEGTSSTSE